MQLNAAKYAQREFQCRIRSLMKTAEERAAVSISMAGKVKLLLRLRKKIGTIQSEKELDVTGCDGTPTNTYWSSWRCNSTFGETSEETAAIDNLFTLLQRTAPETPSESFEWRINEAEKFLWGKWKN